MSVAVSIPGPLRRYVDHAAELEFAAGPLQTLLAHMGQTFPALKVRLLRPDGTLMAHLAVSMRGQLVPAVAISDTVVSDGELLEIVFVASGG
ncbi:MAG: hypothetical protein ABGZ17_17235 [Planctomycetaceae bacterium]